jgi:tetratricopeptide (TPR) repeat protein
MSRQVAALILTALAVAGCASAPATKPEEGRPAFSTLAARFAEMAVASEKSGDLQGAIREWKVVASLSPGNAQAEAKVISLTAEATRKSAAHLQQGVAAYKRGAIEEARKEFILTLVADPGNKEAVEYLKVRLAEDATAYTVTKGETLETIAKKVYGDPKGAAVIAAVNGLKGGVAPSSGQVLLLPLPEKEAGAAPEAGAVWNPEAEEKAPPEVPPAAAPPAAPSPSEELLARAQTQFKGGAFADAAATAGKVAKDDPAYPRAAELVASSLWALAEKQVAEEKFSEALETYRKIDPARRDVKKGIAGLEKKKIEKAEEHYIKGVKLSVDQKLEAAIAEWEITLTLNPGHQKAPRDIQKTRALLEKLKGIQ